MSAMRIYGRLFAMLGRDRWTALGLSLGNLFVAALQFLNPLLFGRVVALLATSRPGGDPWTRIAPLLGWWGAVGVGGIVGNLAVSLLTERMAHRNRLRAMGSFYETALTLPPGFHGDTQTGRLLKVMLGGSESLFSIWLVFFRDQQATFIATLVLLPFTLFMNWRLALSLIVLIVVSAAVTAWVIHKTHLGQQRAEAYISALAGTAQDALANVIVVQSFGRMRDEVGRFGAIAQRVIEYQFPVLNWWAAINVLTRAASTLAVIAIVAIGTWLHLHNAASIADLVAFTGVAMLLIGRLDSAISFIASLFFRMPSLHEFFSVLDAVSNVPDPPDAPALAVTAGEVCFDHAGFAYPGGTLVLRDVSFTAQAGSVTALVGETGAGKSTAMALLQRLWDPTEGAIRIDGQDLRAVSLASLHAAIGVVFQDSLLFNRTIRENLLIGRPDASQEEIERAARQAEAHDFILRQPQGYDTLVGERGAGLSGGQRQRLAIARALLKDPPILILDEATSALDAATEARVARALATLMKGRTTFVIAHRLSTVRDADEILVFDAGTIVERGSFAALVAARGRFADLVASQLSSVV